MSSKSLTSHEKRSLEIIFVAGAFVLWLFIFRGYFLYQLALGGTAPAYYYRIKYYLDGLWNGIYPMWNPFQSWGYPDVLDMRVLGEFNPFLYVIWLLQGVTQSFYQAYLVYLALYYWLGLLGFYLLAKSVLKEWPLAFVAYVMVMFSSLGPATFTENVINLIFVPLAWFFYFMINFFKQGGQRFLLGMTLALMIILTTYFPFFFVTVFVIFAIAFSMIFFSLLKEIFDRGLKQIWQYKKVTIFCITAVCLSLGPDLLWYRMSHEGQFMFDFRHTGSPYQDVLSMDQDMINNSGISGVVTWRGLFSDLDVFAGTEPIFFYIPIFIYLILLLSILNRVNRLLALLGTLGFFLFFITLADATPIHRFLYDHVYFFKLFRNLFFLLYLSIPIYVLFAMEQLRIFLSAAPLIKQKKGYLLVFVTFIHSVFALFLYRLGNVMGPSYLAVFLSWISFVLYGAGFLKSRFVLLTLLLSMAILSQGIAVNFYVCRNAKPYLIQMDSPRETPSFSFIRPAADHDPLIPEARGYAARRKVMRDSSGFVDSEYVGVRWSHFLLNHADREKLEKYTRYKFVLYDRVEFLNDKSTEAVAVNKIFSEVDKTAYIFDSFASSENKQADQPPKEAQFITENSDQFKIVDFNLNELRLKTNFPVRHFLVYNDSFHKDWAAFINGQKVKVWRANYAFKGVWLPAGENVVYFRYGQTWLYGYYLFLIAFMVFFLGRVIWSFQRKNLGAQCFILQEN